MDNQLYVATPSPARDTEATYVAWGHSTVVSPWGEVISKASEKEEIILADIDLEFLEGVRKQIPIGFQKRNDLYQVLDKEEADDRLIIGYFTTAADLLLFRVNKSYKLDSKKVAETFSVDDLGDKTVFCRCWKSAKFPLCDGAHGKHNKACGDNLGPVIVTKKKQ